MKIIGKITLRYIMKNKLRTIFTLLGIIISISMITSIGNILLTLDREFKEDLIDVNGIYDMEIKNISKDNIIDVLGEDIIKDYYIIQRGKNIVRDGGLIGGKKLFDIEIKFGDRRYYKEYFHYKLIEGRLPENERELLIPYEIKDVFFESVKDASYNIVGFYSGEIYRNAYKDGKSIKAIAYSFKDLSNLDEKNQEAEKDLRIFLKNYGSKGDIEKKAVYLEGKIGKKVDINDSYISYNDINLHYLGPFIIGFIGLLVFIVILSVTVFISNIFISNYAEKTRDLGLLKVIGFTNKQILLMILLDSLFYFIIAVPLGFISGVLAMKIVFFKVNMILLESVDGIYTQLKPVTGMSILIISLFIGFLTIFISNLSASIFLFKNSPIDCLEGKGLIKEKIGNKSLGIYKKLKKYISYDFFLVTRIIKRNKRRFLMTTISIAMSIILFVVVSDLTSLFNTPFRKARDGSDRRCGYIVVGEKEFDKLDKDLNRIGGLGLERKTVKYISEIFRPIRYSDNRNLNVIILTDKEFKDRIGADLSKPILFSKDFKFESFEDIYFDMGSSELKEEAGLSKNDIDFKIKKIKARYISQTELKKAKFSPYEMILENNDNNLFISETFFNKLKSNLSPVNIAINISWIGDDPILKYELDRLYFNYEDMYIYGRSDKSIYKITRLFVYGFISLISVIGALNVINSIHSNIVTRKTEIALLKAVGVGEKRLGKLVLMENMISLILAGILSFLGSFIFTIIQYRFKQDNLPETIFIPFKSIYVFPFFYWLIGFVLSGILIYLSMFIPYRRVNLKNITEVLK